MFPFLDSYHSPLSINKEIEEENVSSNILCSQILSFDWCAVYQQVGLFCYGTFNSRKEPIEIR